MEQSLTLLVATVLGVISAITGFGLAFFRKRRATQLDAKIAKSLSSFASKERTRLEALRKGGVLPPLVLSTSPAQAPSGTVEHEAALELLRNQLARIAEQVNTKTGTFVEAPQINPALETSLTLSIENLTKRIETLEKNLLTKWDVVTVFLALGVPLVAVIGVVVTLVIAALR